MDLSHWASFAVIVIVVSLTPGPGVILAISNALAYGPRRAMCSSAGNALGLLVVAAAAATGLGVLLKASATAFLWVKVVGALYLIYLGVKQWRSHRGILIDVPAVAAPDGGRRRSASGWQMFGSGLSVALTNPKTILFFSAFFPQFMKAPSLAAGSLSTQMAILILAFVAGSLLAHVFYMLVARALKAQLGNPRRMRVLNRFFGCSFIALGVGLLRLRAA